MTKKIRVYGKAQNRTALGIVNAYLVMYPHATLDDLKKAFPDALNPDSGVKINFIESGQSTGPGNWEGYFTADDELLTTGDGKKVALVKMWTKPSFERLVSHANQYGIEIAQYDAAEKGFGKKGRYRLEYLNGYVPPVPEKSKKKPLWWLWALIASAAIVFLILFLTKKPEVEVVEKVVEVEKVVTVVDTVYVQQVEDIQKDFNAAQFEQGKADLNDDSKAPLYKLAEVLSKNTEIKLKVVGHTSAEGTPEANQKLSEARAKAAVDFLIARGISAERLSYEGKGSSELLNQNEPKAPENRRTEFIILE